MAYLILVRHGITDWNEEGRWHGLSDIPINEKGKNQAKQSGLALKGLRIDTAYTSDLGRTKQTFQGICDALALSCPVMHSPALNERDYGEYTGKNKWQVKEQLGDKEFQKLRRDFAYPVPGGESLKDVHGRVVPFYQEKIESDLKQGKNVLVVSSGNTLRALIKHLENISDEDISKLELNFGEITIFEINEKGDIIGKENRASDLYGDKR
jgi:2,3-bisphosphoglycerate-dependent phosphoglycerate mutase